MTEGVKLVYRFCRAQERHEVLMSALEATLLLQRMLVNINIYLSILLIALIGLVLYP
jgi:hypothetical protein